MPRGPFRFFGKGPYTGRELRGHMIADIIINSLINGSTYAMLA